MRIAWKKNLNFELSMDFIRIKRDPSVQSFPLISNPYFQLIHSNFKVAFNCAGLFVLWRYFQSVVLIVRG